VKVDNYITNHNNTNYK